MSGRTPSEEFLLRIGDGPEREFDIARAALHLAALSRSRPDIAPFETHLAQLGQELSETFAKSVDESLTAAAQALTNVLVVLNDYRGDDQTYDDLQNADLMNVIERRRGLPVALGILYIHSARSQGWHAHGLNFPGHFQW